MANGIEHRNGESVVSAYRFYELPNFLILCGAEPRISYKGGDIDEGTMKLQQYLDMIEQSNTGAVYTLRVYPADVTNITNKTPYEASTRFLLNANVPVKTDEQGITIIDRSRPAAPTPVNTEMAKRLDKLEEDNRKLQERLTDERINALKQDFDNRIAGLQNQEPEKSPWDRVGEWIDKILDKPESIKAIAGTIKDIISPSTNNYITNPGTTNLAGTNSDTMPENNIETAEVSGPFVNHFLTPEEKKLKKKEQAALMVERLSKIDDDAHETVQNECLESIQSRIGAVTLSRMLIAVASLDDDDMNRLLNNLD